MRLKLISCEVFVREVCMCVAQTPHIVYPEFLELGAHAKPDRLRGLIRRKIEEADEQGIYDAILLCYGLCGNSVVGLTAGRVPLVIPRAHDCCTVFLGSKERFAEHFGGRLSARWSSAGYLERGDSYVRESDVHTALGTNHSYDELVAKYGEENAEYVWETLHPEVNDRQLIYIETPETAHLGYAQRVKHSAEDEGKEFVYLKGDTRIVRDLVYGNWDPDRFLAVLPGQSITAVYDRDDIIRAEFAERTVELECRAAVLDGGFSADRSSGSDDVCAYSAPGDAEGGEHRPRP